jgi:hypothetical protein
LAALGGVLWGSGCCSRNCGLRSIFLPAEEFGYRSQQLAPMTERHPDLFKMKLMSFSAKLWALLPEPGLLKPISDLLSPASVSLPDRFNGFGEGGLTFAAPRCRLELSVMPMRP